MSTLNDVDWLWVFTKKMEVLNFIDEQLETILAQTQGLDIPEASSEEDPLRDKNIKPPVIDEEDKQKLLTILRFTEKLIDNASSKTLYNSVDVIFPLLIE